VLNNNKFQHLTDLPGWDGWHFGPWGKARNHRLIGPNWTSFQPADILAGRQAVIEADQLRQRVRHIERCLDADALHLTPAETAEIHRSIEILERVLPSRRFQQVHGERATTRKWNGFSDGRLKIA
jgi:hypothetical protein